jgi:uncharacterized membrane protein YedE/YeeE
MWIIAPLICGLIFGAGLLISGMVQPTKVLGFLDIFGAWDPSQSGIDLPLVAGAVLFGIGWGLVGLCPGPALESLATLSPGVIVFVVAMAAGMAAHDAWQQSRLTAQRDRLLASAADG